MILLVIQIITVNSGCLVACFVKYSVIVMVSVQLVSFTLSNHP